MLIEVMHMLNRPEYAEEKINTALKMPYLDRENEFRELAGVCLSKKMLTKFAIHDATLAASYSQLAATALGLSSIWIGTIDEEKISKIIGTKLTPSSNLCIGYPTQQKFPKPRRNLKDLIHILENKGTRK